MIEVQIPKDVSVYESPLIGPLTARQSICVAAAAGVEFVYYMIVSNFFSWLDLNSIVGIGVLFAIPFLYLAVGKPYGMRPETYVYYFLLPSLIGNKDRPYQTELIYDTILSLDEDEMEQKQKQKQKQKSKSKSKPKGKQEKMYL